MPLKYGLTHNLWVKDTSNKWQPPQTRSGHHLEREAGLGISHSSRGNLCLPFLQLISKEIPFFFKIFWKLKKKTKNTQTQSTYVIISAFTRVLQSVSDYGWKFVLFSLFCNLCLLLTTSLNTWQKAESLLSPLAGGFFSTSAAWEALWGSHLEYKLRTSGIGFILGAVGRLSLLSLSF